jgi:hypothetical protein
VTGVDVQVKKSSAQQQGVLRMSLLNPQAQVLATQNFEISTLQPDSTLSLPVPLAAAATKYTIKLETPGLPAPDWIGIAINTPKQYRDGDYAVGGKKLPSDLVFHYSCINPWTGK